MATYLDRILAAHRDRAATEARTIDALVEAARPLPVPRGFAAALAAGAERDGVAVIAEIKRRSPSKGALAPNLDPSRLARQYAEGGAACVSVLTDREFFGGSPDDLVAARQAAGVPILRKDFTVSAHDVCDARLMGADCVLLIVAALDPGELRAYHALAHELGLAALVEVHDEDELERALDAGAEIIGVNQRDLVTFAVDQQRAVRVAPHIPDGVMRVAESGIAGPDDAKVLRDAGYHALLVGEALVTAGDPRAGVAALLGAGR